MAIRTLPGRARSVLDRSCQESTFVDTPLARASIASNFGVADRWMTRRSAVLYAGKGTSHGRARDPQSRGRDRSVLGEARAARSRSSRCCCSRSPRRCCSARRPGRRVPRLRGRRPSSGSGRAATPTRSRPRPREPWNGRSVSSGVRRATTTSLPCCSPPRCWSSRRLVGAPRSRAVGCARRSAHTVPASVPHLRSSDRHAAARR